MSTTTRKKSTKGTKKTASKAKGKNTRKTATKKSTKKAVVKRTRQQLDQEGLVKAEKELIAKCKERGFPVRGKPHFIVPGSLRNSKDPRNEADGLSNKRTVEILCQEKGCNETRRVATSDLAQVFYCPTHTHERRLEARRRARQARAASKKSK